MEIPDDIWNKIYSKVQWCEAWTGEKINPDMSIVESARSDIEFAFSMYWTDSEMIYVPPTGYRSKKEWNWSDIKSVAEFRFHYGITSEVCIELTLELNDGRFIYAQAECCASGWFCQSGGRIYMAANMDDINVYAKCSN